MKRLVSALLIVIFFLILGYALLVYATGKRLTRDGNLVGIGIIKVEVAPDNSKIYLNNDFKDQGNTNLENLKPGKYSIKVEKDNYNPWQKEVEVVEGKVTPLKVKLFPSNPSLTAATFNGVYSPKLSPDGRKIAFGIQTEGKKGVWVLDLRDRQFFFNTNTLRQVVSDTTTVTFSNSTLSWSPDSNSVIVQGTNNTTSESVTFLLDQSKLNTTPENVTSKIVELNKSWSDQTNKTNSEKLKKLGKEAQLLAVDYKELLFAKDGSAVIIVKNTGAALVLDTKPTPVPGVKPLTTQLPVAEKYFWFQDGTKHIVAIEKDIISLMDTDGTNKASIFTADFDPNAVFSWPDGTRLVLALNLNSRSNPLPNLYTIDLR